MKQKALRAGDAHSHEDEECRKRSTLRFGRCLTSATGAQQRARRENVPRHILSYVYDEPLRTKIVSAKASTIFESHLHCTISAFTPILFLNLPSRLWAQTWRLLNIKIQETIER